MASRTLTIQEAADELGVHYMTVYKYVRTGKLPATKDGAVWRVQRSDLARLEAAPSGRKSRSGRRVDYRKRLSAPLLAGDEPGAWAVLEGALASGMTAEDLYLEVLGPAMEQIGERWESGDLSVADEHTASAVMHRLVGRLGPSMRRRGRSKGTVVLGAPAGDTHALPVALFADLLRSSGFTVHDLGADVPPHSFVDAVADADRLVGVGITVSRSDNGGTLGRIIDALRAQTSVPIVLGGAAADAALAKRVGADRFLEDTGEALSFFVTEAREVSG